MKGKNRCRILKDIRRRIAEENNIEYITTECKYQGDCLGTCPKCEAEVRYLERELERKRSLGYKVTVAGLAAGITLASAGCTPDTTSSFSSGEKSLTGDIIISDPSHNESSGTVGTSDDISVTVDGEMVETMGDFPAPGGLNEEYAEPGELPPCDESDCSEDDLMGDPSEEISDPSDEIVEPTMGDLQIW